MTLSPAVKGQITKALKTSTPRYRIAVVRSIFERHMPREQANHAARKTVSERAA